MLAFDMASTAFSLVDTCESPIEIWFATYLIPILRNIGIEVVPQYKWQRYRIDFALEKTPGNPIAFIECDGREFHSSPEQRENDRRKDAAAKRAGINMFRFTGKDIYRNGEYCARHVYWGVVDPLRIFKK